MLILIYVANNQQAFINEQATGGGLFAVCIPAIPPKAGDKRVEKIGTLSLRTLTENVFMYRDKFFDLKILNLWLTIIVIYVIIKLIMIKF